MGWNQQQQGISEKLVSIFDWLEFTIHNYSLSSIIIEVLGLKEEDFMKINRGKLGYEEQKLWNEGGICILHNDVNSNDRMGIHVVMSGKGCRQYEAKKSLQQLIQTVSQLEKFKFTRIDIAIDDISGKIINFDKFVKESEAKNLSSLWYKYSVIMESACQTASPSAGPFTTAAKKAKFFSASTTNTSNS